MYSYKGASIGNCGLSQSVAGGALAMSISHVKSAVSRRDLIEELRRQVSRSEIGTEEAEVFSSGVTALDRLLPGGLRHGMLVEWLGAEERNARAGEQKSN